MGDILDVVQDGVRVNVAIDIPSAIVTGVTLFFAITLALVVYGKLIR